MSRIRREIWYFAILTSLIIPGTTAFQATDSGKEVGQMKAETTAVTSQIEQAEIPENPSVELPVERDRLIILGLSLVILIGFGVILERMRRRADVRSATEDNAK